MNLSLLKPQSLGILMELVEEAGLDVSEWHNTSGHAASNPKFCYDWSFVQGDKVVLNLWYENLREKSGKVIQMLNLRERALKEPQSAWRRRAKNVDQAIRAVFDAGIQFRVIICSGDLRRSMEADAKASKVKYRELDSEFWAVASYDYATGACVLERKLIPVQSNDRGERLDELSTAFEGALRERFVKFRHRERKLRNLKILNALSENNGHLVCQVPNCGFDFVEVYGEVGDLFAEVHHEFPLNAFPEEGKRITLDDLVIVCSNCHSMIHRGGQCRPLGDLIKKKHK